MNVIVHEQQNWMIPFLVPQKKIKIVYYIFEHIMVEETLRLLN